MKVFIVDDEPIVARALQRAFSNAGHEVQIASSGDEALAIWGQVKPDLVLLDALMPGFDGIQVLEAVKARALSIPVILVTGNANEAYLKLAMQAGAKGVLAKPFVKEELLDQLGKFLEKKS